MKSHPASRDLLHPQQLDPSIETSTAWGTLEVWINLVNLGRFGKRRLPCES